MKYKMPNLDAPELPIADEGPWFDSISYALNHKLKLLEKEMDPWKIEALAALQSNDIYRGGGVLRLAELMRQHSHISSQLSLTK